jgi:PhoU domain
MGPQRMKDVLDAYAQRDIERALDVWKRDADLDALEDSVFRRRLQLFSIFQSGAPSRNPSGLILD